MLLPQSERRKKKKEKEVRRKLEKKYNKEWHDALQGRRRIGMDEHKKKAKRKLVRVGYLDDIV